MRDIHDQILRNVENNLARKKPSYYAGVAWNSGPLRYRAKMFIKAV